MRLNILSAFTGNHHICIPIIWFAVVVVKHGDVVQSLYKLSLNACMKIELTVRLGKGSREKPRGSKSNEVEKEAQFF